jgi:transposase
MAKGYRPVRRDQPFLLPPDMRDWLPDDHPVHLVIAAIDYLDTSAFHAGRRTGGAGAAGYDPDMLAGVLVWAYAHRVTSSRRIEELCRTDVAFRLICGGNLPDHATIARFRAELGGAAGAFFAQVLALCARMGMGRVGVVALDSTAVAASASRSANRSEEALRKLAAELVAAHAAADAAEDEAFGPGRRGDEVPAGAARPRSAAARAERAARIAAALAQLEAERAGAGRAGQAKAERFRDRQRAGRRTGPAPAGAEVVLAQERLGRAVAAQQAKIDDWAARDAAARAAGGRGLDRRTRPKSPASQHCRARQAAAHLDQARARAAAREKKKKKKGNRAGRAQRNVTDPDSRLLPARGGGFIQGYHAQNVASQDGLIIATRLTADQNDAPWFEPMLAAAQDAAALITARQPAERRPGDRGGEDGAGGDRRPGGGEGGDLIGLVLADAGYLSEANLTCPGPDRLIAVGRRRALDKAARGGDPAGDPAAGPATKAMAARLQTPAGSAAYRHRGHIAETPHGHLKHTLGFRQFSVRGKRKTAAEWAFACAVHNLLTAITAGRLTSHAVAALAS